MNITSNSHTYHLDNSIDNGKIESYPEINCYLLKLPPELIIKIISKLDIKERVQLIKTCSRMKNIINTDKKTLHEINIYKNFLSFKKQFTKEQNTIFDHRLQQEFLFWLNSINITDKQQLKDINFIKKICNNKIQFNLANIMADGFYYFIETHSYKAQDFMLHYFNNFESYNNKLDALKILPEADKFLLTLNPAVFIVTQNNNALTLFDAFELGYFSRYHITNTLIVQDFIIIVFSSISTVFFKNINGVYKNVTPYIDHKQSQHDFVTTLENTKNKCQFLIEREYKLYIYKEKQLKDTEIKTNKNLWEILQICKNLVIYGVRAAKNKLILISGRNKKTKGMEISIYKYTKYIATIIIENKSGDRKYPDYFECSPEGDFFAIGVIEVAYNKYSSKSCELTVYKIDSDNNISQVLTTTEFHKDLILKYSHTGKFLSVVSKTKTSIYAFNYDTNTYSEININAVYHTHIPYFNSSDSLCYHNFITDNKIIIHDFAERELNRKIMVNCKGKNSFKVDFSPNSQLLAVLETETLLSATENTIRVYRIMSKHPDNNMQLLPEAELIAQYTNNNQIYAVKFHPNGFNVIIDLKHEIKILQFIQVTDEKVVANLCI
jgi:hypothetical protein